MGAMPMSDADTGAEVRECRFEDCDWSHEFDSDGHGDRDVASYRTRRHYEREHGGRVRIRVTLEREQILGDRDPHDVADRFHDSFEDRVGGWDVSYAVAEVVEEPDDHSKVVGGDDDG